MSTDEQRHLQHESSSSTAGSLSSVSDVEERDGIIRKSRGSPECKLNYVRPSLWAQKSEIVTLKLFN